MTTALDGIARLLIDGNNLLHRVSGGVDDGAIRLLLARLTNAMPPTVDTIVMFDGHAAAGTDRRQRVRRGLEIHHAGSLSADEALLNIVRDMAASDRAGVVLVTDDRSLTDKGRHLGARTHRLDWLEALLAGPSPNTATAGIGRKGIKQPPAAEPERQPWHPGRGATTKRGNPKRAKRERADPG